jgi:hypothetical protein
MDVKTYCNTLESQLNSWKSNINEVAGAVDRLPEGEKEKVFTSIRSLHAVVEEIDGQLDQLMTECPEDWSASHQSVEAKMNDLKQTLHNLSEMVSGPLIPDSLSWVSK